MPQIKTSISQGRKRMTKKDMKSQIKTRQANINPCSLSASTVRKNGKEMRTGKLMLRAKVHGR